MKIRNILSALAVVYANLAFAQSQAPLGTPYVTDYLNSASQSGQLWQINGNVASEDSGGLGVTNTGGAAFISSVAVPDASHQYQLTVRVNSLAGASYVLYLEA